LWILPGHKRERPSPQGLLDYRRPGREPKCQASQGNVTHATGRFPSANRRKELAGGLDRVFHFGRDGFQVMKRFLYRQAIHLTP
jgi:hypothetical protein